ncbi:MAG: sulfotransferase [Rhodobacteraceae bacterium]|nr:sulfotransferase [Paracoccaceae bacterium]
MPIANQNTAKTFLLGVGAPKAGTTWLYKQLAKNPETTMGFLKEYHVFDALTVPECEEFRTSAAQLFASRRSNPIRLLNPKVIRQLIRLKRRDRFYQDLGFYYAYFSGLLSQKNTILTGDITPSYAGLPETTLASIRDGFEARGIRIRVIYLMRDPVERCWSAVRMHRQNRFKIGHDNDLCVASEVDHLERSYRSDRFVLRGSYHKTIGRLRSVFAPEQVKIILYEDLFDDNTMKDIFQFLGLQERQVDTRHRVNATRKDITLPVSLQSEIAHFYKDAYLAAAEEFSTEHLLSRWKSASFVLDT